jgi:dTDP-glucose pyrophosphorylase
MKAVILAGGFGTRISEESAVRPKPMIEIGHKPILWPSMKISASHQALTDDAEILYLESEFHAPQHERGV